MRNRMLPLAIVALASLVAVVAVFALWAKRQALETDSWVETSTELLEREEIRDALALYLVAEIYDNVDVQAEIAALLPPQAAPLAGPAAGGLRQGAEQVAMRALEQPRVQSLWEDANRGAHESLITVVEGGGENLSTEGGVVTLDLAGILTEVAAQTGIPSSVVEKLPPEVATLEILRSEELEAAQKGVDLLETLAWVLTALALALYALAVFLGGERRRETLRAVGISFAGIGIAVLVGRELAGDSLVSSLTANEANEPAVAATWSIGTSMLAEIGGAMILYGIAIVFSAWLVGPTGVATAVRSAIAPYYRQPRFAYGTLVLVLLLLFWWNPTPATERLLPSLLLIGLLTLGTELLRRRVIREFPERVTTFSAAGLAQTMAGQTREAMARRTQARTEAQEGAAAAGRLDALERLGQLRESGVLSEEEFKIEKARLIGGATPAPEEA